MRKMQLFAGAAAVAAAGLLTAATTGALAQAPQPLTEGVAAVVNDQIISTYDLRQRMMLLILTSGVRATEQSLPQIQQEALRGLIDERLQMQELQRVGREQKVDLVAEDVEVDEEIGQLAQENRMTVEQLRASFATAGVNLDTLREQIRAQMSWQRLISGRYGTRVRVGQDQVDAVLARMAASANQTEYLISEIYIDPARVGGMTEAVNGAQQLVNQLQQGAPFAAVARQFSRAPTAINGGDAGWVSAPQVSPEVATALETLRPGQLSAPIQTNEGVYIIHLREKQVGGGAPVVALKQAAVRLPADPSPEQIAAATETLEQVRPRIATCADVERAAAEVPGVTAADLGEAEIGELAPAFREAAETLDVNQISQPIRTPVGLHLVAMCGKRAAGANAPSRDDVQNRLYAQQLGLMSRRYLRDLRTSATIEEAWNRVGAR